MARILILGGDARALALARRLLASGHAVRVVAEGEGRCRQVEAAGAECFVGTPDRLATLRGALEHVAVACWLFSSPSDAPGCEAADLHGSRLRQFLAGAVDSTLRGFLYEAQGGELEPAARQEGERIVAEMAARNAIPAVTLRAGPDEPQAWLAQAVEAVGSLLGER